MNTWIRVLDVIVYNALVSYCDLFRVENVIQIFQKNIRASGKSSTITNVSKHCMISGRYHMKYPNLKFTISQSTKRNKYIILRAIHRPKIEQMKRCMSSILIINQATEVYVYFNGDECI